MGSCASRLRLLAEEFGLADAPTDQASRAKAKKKKGKKSKKKKRKSSEVNENVELSTIVNPMLRNEELPQHVEQLGASDQRKSKPTRRRLRFSNRKIGVPR